MTISPVSRRSTAVLGVVLVVALAARVLFVVAAREHGSNLSEPAPLAPEAEFLRTGNHSGDSEEYLGLAEGIRQGVFGWDGRPGAFRMPGYPAFLALFGSSLPLVLAAQVLLGLGAIVLAWLAVRRLFGEVPAHVTAACMAADVALVMMAGVLLAETLFVFLLALGAWLFVTRRHALSGLVLGAAVAVRPAGVLLFIPFALALVPRRQWRGLVLFVLLFAVVPAAWAGRNLLRFGRAGLSTDGPFNLYYNSAARLVQAQEGVGPDDVRRGLARELAAEEPGENPLALAGAMTRLALRRIASDPVRYARVHFIGMGNILFGVQSDELVLRLQGRRVRPSFFELAREGGVGPLLLLLTGLELGLTLLALLLGFAAVAFRRGRAARVLILLAGLYFILLGSPLANGRLRVPAMPFLYAAAASIFARRDRGGGPERG